MPPLKRSLLIFAALCAASLTSAQAAQPSVDPEFAADVVDRYANHIYYGSGAIGMALVVIDGNQRVFRSFGETRPGNNEHPQLDSVIRIASLSKLMTSEMLVKLLDQGVVKLNDPLSKYAPPGARVPTYQGAPITLVNLATHTSALPREQPGGAAFNVAVESQFQRCWRVGFPGRLFQSGVRFTGRCALYRRGQALSAAV